MKPNVLKHRMRAAFAAAFALLASCAAFAAPHAPYDASLADFPKLEGEEYDSARIIRAIQSVPHGVLYIPAGIYELDKSIRIDNSASLLLHKSARLIAMKKMDFILRYDSDGSYKDTRPKQQFDTNLFVRGGEFDGRGVASCIKVENYSRLIIGPDTTLRNPKEYGLFVGRSKKPFIGASLIVEDVYFDTCMSGLAGNTAVCTEDDNGSYTDIVITECTTSFKVAKGASNNILTRVHEWGGCIRPKPNCNLPEMLEKSVAFDLAGRNTVVNDSYADTAETGYRINGGDTRLIGCRYFNNTNFRLQDVVIIDYLDGNLLVSEGLFVRGGTKKSIPFRGKPKKKNRVMFERTHMWGHDAAQFTDLDAWKSM